MSDNGVIFDEAEIQQMVGVLIEECVGEKACDKEVQLTYQDIRSLLDKEDGVAATLAARYQASYSSTCSSP